MAKLSDSQLVVLSTACQRPDGCVFPVPLKLKGNAVGNVLKSLLTKGYVEEVPGRADDTVWRYDDGAPLTLKASRAAYDALGIELDADPAIDDDGLVGGRPADQKRVAAIVKANDTPRQQRAPRKDSKQAQLIALLRRAKGATIDEIVEALDWQAHTVRGAIAGALKKKLGLNIVSDKSERRGRIYRIVD